jgi:hypothetical protein
MKNLIIFGIFILLLICVQFTQAQSVDEIIKMNLEAMGGKGKLAALKTAKLEGVMDANGVELNIVTTKAHMTGLRMDIEAMGVANYQVANPSKGSVFMPVSGMTEPTEMEPDQFLTAQSEMDLQGALFNYKEKGHTVELVGMEEVAGKPAHKLKVKFKNGKESFYFIDEKTNRLVRLTRMGKVGNVEKEIELLFSDWKQNGDGYWFPYTVVSTYGTITYSNITTNQPVDENIFKN